ncbi:MAG TPA: hypothetical protein VHN81_11300, partial [Edaphobacter sp.]|nr:hypothetical protein [Edaphobacter sp.]
GTVLRTTDDGTSWQRCSTPPGADHLDFRGIQAFDRNTAIVMSSGKGGLSRLYKTNDGCKSWKLVFTNPDKEGFWDAIKFPNRDLGFLLGDPVSSHFSKPDTYNVKTKFKEFALFATQDGGEHFKRVRLTGNVAQPEEQGAFAASNSSMFVGWPFIYFGSGGIAGPRVYLNAFQQHIAYADSRIEIESGEWGSNSWPLPLAKGEAAGVFSIAFKRSQHNEKEDGSGTSRLLNLGGIAVGGDYKKPAEQAGTSATTNDGGQTWTAAQTPPHGYRSSVAYDFTTQIWVTVGPNGTDISRDDGANWVALKPSAQDQPDADKNWNALSLPFAVGPNGRIGELRRGALRAVKRSAN